MQKLKEKAGKFLNSVKLHAQNTAALAYNFGITAVMLAEAAWSKIRKKRSRKKPAARVDRSFGIVPFIKSCRAKFNGAAAKSVPLDHHAFIGPDKAKNHTRTLIK